MCSGSLFAHKRGFRPWGEKGRKMRNRKKMAQAETETY